MARVLIVDDQSDVREALVAVVECEGHDVFEAEGATDVESKVLECRPDVVLMDANMPGVDGFEALRRLKADACTRPVPVIMVTVLDHVDARSCAAALGADAYITKPWGDGEIEWRIRQVLGGATAAATRAIATAVPLAIS